MSESGCLILPNLRPRTWLFEDTYGYRKNEGAVGERDSKYAIAIPGIALDYQKPLTVSFLA
jgi:hypothetical protein